MAADFADVIRDNETKSSCKNCLRDYFIGKYEEFINLHLVGKAAVRQVVVLFSLNVTRNAAVAASHPDLKRDDTAMAPTFHSYDPAAINAAVKERSIIITDIPLFFAASDITTYFKKFGLIDDYKFSTPKGANFQKAVLTFQDANAVRTFGQGGRWSIFTQGHCLRVYPSTLTPEEQKNRLQYSAVLKNLPPNLKAIDL